MRTYEQAAKLRSAEATGASLSEDDMPADNISATRGEQQTAARAVTEDRAAQVIAGEVTYRRLH